MMYFCHASCIYIYCLIVALFLIATVHVKKNEKKKQKKNEVEYMRSWFEDLDWFEDLVDFVDIGGFGFTFYA